MKDYALVVRGENHRWFFPVRLPEHAYRDMVNDGLDLEVHLYSIPRWAPVGLWMWCSDLLHFRFLKRGTR